MMWYHKSGIPLFIVHFYFLFYLFFSLFLGGFILFNTCRITTLQHWAKGCWPTSIIAQCCNDRQSRGENHGGQHTTAKSPSQPKPSPMRLLWFLLVSMFDKSLCQEEARKKNKKNMPMLVTITIGKKNWLKDKCASVIYFIDYFSIKKKVLVFEKHTMRVKKKLVKSVKNIF